MNCRTRDFAHTNALPIHPGRSCGWSQSNCARRFLCILDIWVGLLTWPVFREVPRRGRERGCNTREEAFASALDINSVSVCFAIRFNFLPIRGLDLSKLFAVLMETRIRSLIRWDPFHFMVRSLITGIIRYSTTISRLVGVGIILMKGHLELEGLMFCLRLWNF